MRGITLLYLLWNPELPAGNCPTKKVVFSPLGLGHHTDFERQLKNETSTKIKTNGGFLLKKLR
jgi:hypothetical protein